MLKNEILTNEEVKQFTKQLEQLWKCACHYEGWNPLSHHIFPANNPFWRKYERLSLELDSKLKS